jgi:hypothetical protein
MPSLPPYLAENEAALADLRALLARLSDEDLKVSLGEGWTVAAMLVHLAFWDQRQLAVLEKWHREGVKPVITESDIVNAALLPLALSLPPQTAAQLALQAAEAINQAVAQVTPDMADQIEAIDHSHVLWRVRHRRDHLNQISQALGLA